MLLLVVVMVASVARAETEELGAGEWSHLDQATLLLSTPGDTAETADIHNNPLDNLSDLREIHQFHIDLSNYTDHLAVESSAVHTEPAVINDHFDILPDVDTRDFNHTGFYSGEEEALDSEAAELNPALYEVVTSTAEENEQKTYDETLVDTEHFDGGSRQEGMDGKYYTLLENIHRKIHERMNQTEGEGEEEAEVHHEDNDVLHPLISLTAIKPNSMRLAITPKTYSKDAMVRLMYKRVPRNKPALMQHLDDPIIEYIQLYRLDQEHFLSNLPMGKYIVCADYTVRGVIVQHDCFETIVDRLDTNELQGGVVGIIALAIFTLVSCMAYAIYHRCIKMKAATDPEEIISSKH